LGLYLLGHSTSYFFSNLFFRLDMQKKSSKIFIVLTPWWSNIIIFQSLNDIVVFFFLIWSLTCLVWICMVTILKKLIQLIKMLAFVQFRANSSRLKTSLGHLGVKRPFKTHRKWSIKVLHHLMINFSIKATLRWTSGHNQCLGW